MPKLNLDQAKTKESSILKAIQGLGEGAQDERRKMKKQLRRIQRRRRLLAAGVPEEPAAPVEDSASEGDES